MEKYNRLFNTMKAFIYSQAAQANASKPKNLNGNKPKPAAVETERNPEDFSLESRTAIAKCIIRQYSNMSGTY